MPIFQGTYTITNLNSQTRVDLDGGTKVQGWAPLTPDVPEYPNQVWKVQYTNKPGVDSTPSPTCGPVHTSKSVVVISLSPGNATDGTPITCSAAAAGDQTTDDQEWEFVKVDKSG
ncbi:hypothetical protein B0H19DRAFT_1066094 [Mycena capillaripes]|nr:hypothetical protein B0H19DRAFT_1066094 [Mycena capillaripes]